MDALSIVLHVPASAKHAIINLPLAMQLIQPNGNGYCVLTYLQINGSATVLRILNKVTPLFIIIFILLFILC